MVSTKLSQALRPPKCPCPVVFALCVAPCADLVASGGMVVVVVGRVSCFDATAPPSLPMMCSRSFGALVSSCAVPVAALNRWIGGNGGVDSPTASPPNTRMFHKMRPRTLMLKVLPRASRCR
eukprot:5359446-Heterocapsa_arctica.AAC.1